MCTCAAEASCENTDVNRAAFPYKEQLVLQWVTSPRFEVIHRNQLKMGQAIFLKVSVELLDV